MEIAPGPRTPRKTQVFLVLVTETCVFLGFLGPGAISMHQNLCFSWFSWFPGLLETFTKDMCSEGAQKTRKTKKTKKNTGFGAWRLHRDQENQGKHKQRKIEENLNEPTVDVKKNLGFSVVFHQNWGL